jgi:hypothetical protein
MEHLNLNSVIPAQAGIHNHDISSNGDQQRASFCTVTGLC